MSFDIRCEVVGPVETNCYYVINTATKETIVFDPGDSGDELAAQMRKEMLIPVAILLTHGHFDHILGIPEFRKSFPVPVYAHEEEEEVLANANLNSSGMIGRRISMKADHYLKDGDILNLAGLKIQVLFTPGHTKGGVSYYMEELHTVICGDTLFQNSVGRTDFPTGSMGTLVKSIREKLFTLDDDVTVLPGHGPKTTIGWEKQYNPFVN